MLDPKLQSLADAFLTQDRTSLEPLRARARAFETVDALWDALELPELEEGAELRFFALGPSERERGVLELDLHEGRLRPVGRTPGNKALACFVASVAPAVAEAERHARDFARALWTALSLDAPPERVVWKHSGWGAIRWSPRHPPSLTGFEAVLSTVGPLGPAPDGVTSAFAWLVQRVQMADAWNEARRDGRVADVDLLGPFEALWRTGCGISAVNDDCIVLFLSELDSTPALRGELQPDVGVQHELAAAAARSDPERIEHALQGGADPRKPGPRGMTALHQLASVHGFPRGLDPGLAGVRAFEKLVAAGADPMALDGNGNTPLLLISGNPTLVRTLVQRGLKVDGVGPCGQTILHLLAQRGGSAGPMQMFVELGVPVDARDVLGWTAMHHAHFAGHADNARNLVRSGADPTARTRSGLGRVELHTGEHAPEPTGPPADRRLPRVPDLRLPEALREGALRGDVESWTVLADWLTEQGDPRGEVIALALAGRALDADAVLEDHREAWWVPIAGVHPAAETMLVERGIRMRMDHGFAREVEVRSLRRPDSIDALLALIGSPFGELVEQLHLRTGCDRALEGLVELRSAGLERVRLDRIEGSVPELRLDGLRGLRTLNLRGRALEGLEVRSRSLRSLTVHLPFLRDAALDPPIATLETPALASLSLTLHRAPGPASGAVLRALSGAPSLENLHLRPVDDDLLDAVVAGPLDRLRTLRLDSVFPRLVRRIVDHAAPFAHLDRLSVSVLNADRAERRELERALRGVLPGSTLKGASYRAAGGYG